MLALTVAGGAQGRARTTFEQTILDRDGDNRLEPGPRDDYEVRAELGGPPAPDRSRTRVPQIFFGQMTDMHVVDEESPLRVEFLDRIGPPFTSAYRPQEGLSA
ncbi:MAG: TIGR03767 family metallophosphoesterase, partial [Thermoleophilaceae bacterium]|nr:TIGR03767 family metallophosphoesterase [Thermoleophilaceae bacterium]